MAGARRCAAVTSHCAERPGCLSRTPIGREGHKSASFRPAEARGRRPAQNEFLIMPKSRQELFECLDALGIAHTTVEHAPVFTVAESQSLRDQIPGGHTKNLFLKDKKGACFLVTLEENAEVDLKGIHTLIGASGRVSFGKPEALMEKLGVTPGSVTILSAINDPAHEVTIVIDAPLMEHDIINAHPLSNDATTSIGRDDLLRFLDHTGHVPMILKVSA